MISFTTSHSKRTSKITVNLIFASHRILIKLIVLVKFNRELMIHCLFNLTVASIGHLKMTLVVE